MKDRLLVAFLALGVAACDNDPPSRRDASVDAAATDTSDPAEASPADTQSPDTAPDAGASSTDSPTIDGGASDVAPDRAPDRAGDLATPLPRDGSTDAGVTCGPGAPREMLCTTYCDGIGRFCTREDTQYRNADECRAACNAPTWACGNPGESTGNSLFCRLAHVALAGVGAAATECPNAGPNSPTCR